MSRKFVIVSDSCCDLRKELRDEYDIEYIPMRTIFDGNDLPASLDWEYIPYKTFYDNMRKGTRYLTSQINEETYTERFVEYLEKGCDILSISCSSALSASVKGSARVAEKLRKQYPSAKIYCVDSLNSCFGLSLLCITASKMRAEGKTIDEVYNWLEANKLTANQVSTVDSLGYLRRAGRVSASSAIFGGLMDIKPIIISDAVGQNAAVEKVRGRRLAIKRIVSMFEENYLPSPYQIVCVAHADCLAEAEDLKKRIEEVLPDKNLNVMLENIGPIVGASAGPGTVAVYFFGKEVTANKPV